MAISALPPLNSTSWFSWASDIDAAARTAAQTPSGGTDGQVLAKSGSVLVWITPATGGGTYTPTDATTTAKGIIQLAGVLAGTAANPSLVPTGVTAQTVGDTTHIPVITVGSDGRITTISTVVAAASGYNATAVNAQIAAAQSQMSGISAKTASYTPVLADAGYLIEMNSTSALTFTVPSGIFATGTVLKVVQYNTGVVTIVAGSGVTLRYTNGLKTNGQYASIALTLLGSNEWLVEGNTTV